MVCATKYGKPCARLTCLRAKTPFLHEAKRSEVASGPVFKWRLSACGGARWAGGRNVDAAAPYVRHVAHAERRRHVGNVLALRKATGGTRVGLQHVSGSPGVHFAKAPAREFAPSASLRDRLATAHFDVGGKVVGNDGLLKPTISSDATRRPSAIASMASKPWLASSMRPIEGPIASRTARISLVSSSMPNTILSKFDARESLPEIVLNLANDVVERIARAQAMGSGRIGL